MALLTPYLATIWGRMDSDMQDRAPQSTRKWPPTLKANATTASLRHRLAGVCSALVVPVLFACTAPISMPQPPPAIDTERLFRSWADDVILPELRNFVDDATVLEESTGSYAAYLNNEAPSFSASSENTPSAQDSDAGDEATAPSVALLARAQEAWKAAMLRWQRLEVMQVGPAGMPGIMMGGQGLRDEIYSWPSVNPCGVDQQIFANTFEATDYFKTKLVTFYGLDALEYVLFTESRENACSAAATLNREGQWSQLSDTQRQQRRASYANAVARQLRKDAQSLLSAWESDEGGFRDGFVFPGTDGSAYGNASEVINQVFAALFYIELKVKDRKLAVPTGLHVDCTQQTCPEFLESHYANISKDMIAANLEGFSAIFFGSSEVENAFGFDDYLVAVGAESLAESIRIKLEDAQTQLSEIPGSLREQLLDDPQAVILVHENIKALTNDVKSQMVAALNLDVPQEGAGDND